MTWQPDSRSIAALISRLAVSSIIFPMAPPTLSECPSPFSTRPLATSCGSGAAG
ncbi:hypothetical protein COCC4DRAFT_148314 [Bipolaris maydis ATCC 48331]|uniref:Uncharacterized protein n=2 Tax=Cochliobolus heterostrophus TaxID=5016 RepID=M2VC08_COCH5|nr:uncharacterized protein COCC4DRAFT_148314 [Bipolaris maydis ATCC 48331]EMD97502.1 hypothetical protein COCHEDRAFT_1087022 [Bipolaris maydis C5]ENI01360.1 hypothetical protein COCC4DRAFT_148314 [Bipolaris maydis ATCC 48331]